MPSSGWGSGNVSAITAGNNITISPSGGTGTVTVNAIPSGVTGSIQFATSGAFASDNANLFWDDGDDMLGIGTAAPEESLHVVGNVKITNDIFLGSTKRLFLDGGSNTYLRQSSADVIDFVTGGTSRVTISTSQLNAEININVGSGKVYKQSGVSGVGSNGTVFTFGGGGSGDIASLTIAGGIVTAVATVP